MATLKHSADMQIIPASEYVLKQWHNGLGWTREIYQHQLPEHDHWLWRLSIADINKTSAFSRFDATERILLLLQGQGLVLENKSRGEQRKLDQLFDSYAFNGEEDIEASLTDGAVQVFNVMVRQGQIQATLIRRPLVGSMVFFADSCTSWAIYMVNGRAGFSSELSEALMDTGDTAILSSRERRRYLLEGSGDIWIIRFDVNEKNQ